ncbi:MAG: SsrA-binding protein SmpB [Candidatus Microsaccharimonas sossegonensis]|uniref:SsrA-binding protein n=1 Tax=Candidatus Microsaccharimonas sossegonensis TaxID=2506948 RepID=A0A4Q0AHZ7_9BACT|nr:MAG: SsrA-binding protein SmpB [Candidatus Microsaccharimonas sossegonensis]
MAAQKKKQPGARAIVNRRASFDYALGDELVTGIALTGREARAARDGRVQLKGSFVTIRQTNASTELWLNNASFSLVLNTKNESDTSVDTSPRKLLAKRREIDELADRKHQGMTIVPLKLLTQGRHIKLVIALGKGRKQYDKRQSIKLRDQQRDAKVRL